MWSSLDFPGGASGKETTCSSILGPGRFPGGHGNPFQYSCLENPMDRGAWQAAGHSVAQSQTRLKLLSTHTLPCEDTATRCLVWTRKRAPLRDYAIALILEFSASRTVTNEFLLYWYFVIAVKGTKTVFIKVQDINSLMLWKENYKNNIHLDFILFHWEYAKEIT